MAKRWVLKGLLLLVGIIGIYGFINVADDPLARIKQQLEKWTNQKPIEKAYLQLDKPYYAAGDDIWFKAYVVSGSDHRLSSISGILNVDLIDQRDSIKQSIKLVLNSGTANGDFALPDTLRQGEYRIRAYTNYMRNAGSDYFFNASVSIINHQAGSKQAAVKTTLKTNQTDLQFFPESGYLVNGITSTVAFKAVAANGLGIDIKGLIKNNQGQQVAQFFTTHLGMGSFEMTPVTGSTYHAEFTDADGVSRSVTLPAVAANGYVLKVISQSPKMLTLQIGSTQNLLNAGTNQQPTLVAQSSGKILYTGKVPVSSLVTSLNIPKAGFPSGVLQLTLFSPTGEPLNERLVFIQNPDKLNLTIAANQQVYVPRQKVRLTLDAKTAGNFSVAVTDETKVPVDDSKENNILSNLLLTSDLKGNIEQPAYYFNSINAQTQADLDLLMLTQGYRRFEWKRILNDDFAAERFHPEKALQVAGSVLTVGGKPVPNAKVALYDLDSIKFTREALTDAQGRFAFRNLTFDDSVRFIVQARTDKNKRNVDIKMDMPVPVNTAGINVSSGFDISTTPNLSAYAQSSKQLYSAQRQYGLGNHVFTLQEVVIHEKKELLKSSSNLNGAGNADQIVLGKSLRDLGCVNISDCLQGRLLGVIFRGGIPYSTRDYRPMQLVVDGAYVEGSYLNNLNYNDIQGIEILRNIGLTAIYGSHGGSGVMVVTTTRGGDDDDEPQPIYGRGITTYYPKGYYKARTFYSPRYDESKTNKQLADLRTTIYWKPNVLTAADGKAYLEYFNAASKGTYRVVIEGIGTNGEIGRQVYHYQVQ